MSFLTIASSKRRPMSRLMAKNVFSGLVTAWRFAGSPISRPPSFVDPPIDGVVRIPSAFSITFGWLPSITATQELVVPRSMPITFDIVQNLVLLTLAARRQAARSQRPRIDLVTSVPRRDAYLELLQ